jgi:hypothetical protein
MGACSFAPIARERSVELQPAETTLYSLSESPLSPSQERRDGDRLTTLYRVGSLLIAERRELCLIKNISAGGMMVRVYCGIAEGTRLAVELKCGEPIAGTVSWARDALLGITFDAPIEVIDILSNPTDGPRPRLPRVEINETVSVREGATTYRLKLCDISQGGLKVEGDTALANGSHVVVTIAGTEPLPGVVRWTAGQQMGITFNKMMALPTLVEWLHAHIPAPGSNAVPSADED